MDNIKEKKILHLLGNINEKIDEVSVNVDSENLKAELAEYREHFERAKIRLENKFRFE